MVLLFTLSSLSLFAQDDLLDLLDEQVEEEPVEVAYTFKSTHIINSHTIERMKKNQLDFRVNHRFGEINSGAYDFWGLDNALISLDLGYGIYDWLMVGIRRSTFEKTYDASLKFTLWRQTSGAKVFPVSISYYTNMAINSMKDELMDSLFSYRLNYTHQMLIARKFNEAISVQIMPTFVHRNLVDFDEENTIFSIGVGGRYKFTRRLALTAEYFWANHTMPNDKYFNPLSFGIDIETGGHVFQLFFSNTRIMEETGFISETSGSWLDGGIYFGFNISRVFAIGGNAH